MLRPADQFHRAEKRSWSSGIRRVWWIAAAFLAVQVGIIGLGASGPFVDESLYTVAGLRALEGRALSDGYGTWFNGSPFVWPVIAALGHHLGGLSGARLMAAILSTLTLVALAGAAENLFGRSVSQWCALAFGVNGLFLALAHFAVYDVVALTGVAVSMWCLSRASPPEASGAHVAGWVIAGAVAFAGAVIAKYGYMAMVVPLVGLLVSVRRRGTAGALAVFLSVAGAILAGYFLLCFGSLFPPSSGAYFDQTFGRSRGHIAVLQIVFGVVPFALASVGALVAWGKGRRLLVVTCLAALSVYPAFHLWTGNFVSGQKHVVAGFLFAYLLAGVALERLGSSRSRATPAVVLGLLIVWGGVQCYWQDRSWGDTRILASYLATNMQPGDRVVAESSWNYTLYLYPGRVVESPADVIDANHSPDRNRRDLCRIPWVVGDPERTDLIRYALEHCGHRRVASATTRQYYFDTSQLRLKVSPVVVGVYRLPRP